MTIITGAMLKLIGARCGYDDAEVHAAALDIAMRDSTVKTPRHLAAFLGQIMVETAGFTTLEESFAYRSPERLDALFRNVKGVHHARKLIAAGPEAIANCVYANRLGNGPEESGDGWRFRGSGYKQLTGADNFLRFGRKIGLDLIAYPEQARRRLPAARLAFRYWDACGCSSMADDGDIEGITEAVNGPALLALSERRKFTDVGLSVISFG